MKLVVFLLAVIFLVTGTSHAGDAGMGDQESLRKTSKFEVAFDPKYGVSIMCISKKCELQDMEYSGGNPDWFEVVTLPQVYKRNLGDTPKDNNVIRIILTTEGNTAFSLENSGTFIFQRCFASAEECERLEREGKPVPCQMAGPALVTLHKNESVLLPDLGITAVWINGQTFYEK